jgi:hypothetical protein
VLEIGNDEDAFIQNRLFLEEIHEAALRKSIRLLGAALGGPRRCRFDKWRRLWFRGWSFIFIARFVFRHVFRDCRELGVEVQNIPILPVNGSW